MNQDDNYDSDDDESISAYMESSPTLKLMGEISEKSRIISSLPPCTTREELIFKAKHQKALGRKLEEYDLFIEKQRREMAVREHKELHPPNTEGECPICLEEIENVSAASFRGFLCCGNGICKSCADNISENPDNKMTICPLCRSDFSDDPALIKKRAKDGRSWAQCEIGRRYRDGAHGLPVDTIKALKWLELAAAQNNPVAMYEIYQIKYESESLGNNFSRKSMEKSIALVTQSADLGYFPAQARLAEISYTGRGGPMDMSTSAYYITLAYCQDQAASVAFQIGVLFLEGWDAGPADGGFEKSLYRAKYYLDEAVDKGFTHANGPLGVTLQELGSFQYNGQNNIPGYSCIPRARSCFQKAASTGDPRSKEYLAGIERNSQHVCSNCDKPAKLVSGGVLSRCKRCKASWYCGRDCQVKHWKLGHKVDCVKQDY